MRDRLTQALEWFDANRDGTREEFLRSMKRGGDMLLTACQTHGFVVPRGEHFELTIPGARRLYALRSRE